jgi:hypothetical protein
MNDPSHDNDEMLFDRLVDGELAPDERRRLLASLDDRTDGWQRCALAFLEAQTWGSEIRRLVGESWTKPLASLAPLEVPNSGTKLAASSTWRTGAWFAIAAGLMLAFGLGRQMGGSRSFDRPAGPAELAVEAPSAPAGAGSDRALSDADAITLIVHDSQGVPQRVQVPLVEGRRLGRLFADAPLWAAPEIRERLAEQGLDLHARRRYAPLFFEQQDRIVPMVVPVDDAVVTPVSRPIY